ncbi:MAG: FtsH protease activity modulator HflK [Gammaproteobacteria bacterium]|nr:FtsH protease activity modulator HflK [Gammaproteobacteria bacterium]
MSWNEPEQKDPWKRKPQKQDGPPDLDELVKKLQKKINSVFGGKKSAGKDGSIKISKPHNTSIISFFVVLAILIWALSGIFIVSPAERSAVLRFGKYVRTVGPGPHWIPRFIESKNTVNVQSVSNYPYQAEMLTKDANIVSVAVAVQYRISNVQDYLFSVNNPTQSLQQATASALRQVVGRTTLDEILTTGREQAREEIQKQLMAILQRYHTGFIITDVTLLPVKPPEAVTEAFDDVNKAREDEQRYINSAKAYQQKVVPIAKGQAARMLQAAQAYQQQVVLRAHGDTANFLALLPKYLKSPQVLSEKIYLTTMEAILKHTSKIMISAKGNSNVMYLPIDKLMSKYSNATKIKKITDADTGVTSTQNVSTNPAAQLAGNRPTRASYSNGGAL